MNVAQDRVDALNGAPFVPDDRPLGDANAERLMGQALARLPKALIETIVSRPPEHPEKAK